MLIMSIILGDSVMSCVQLQVSPLHYASVEMTDLWGVRKSGSRCERECPTHHEKAVMNGAPRSGGGLNKRSSCDLWRLL